MHALPGPVRALLSCIRRSGGYAWVVGGALRDLLLHKIPGDWDIATDLPPEEILALFPGGRLIGGVCGTVYVRFRDMGFEITPCRAEGPYSDKRHPDEVRFGAGILADLARRDFTINAMAYDGEVLLDPFGGQRDLAAKVVRCVGDPLRRFEEDSLRILRLFRFAAVLGFVPEKRTLAAACKRMDTVALLPRERVRGEMQRILLSKHPAMVATLVRGGALMRYGFYYAPTSAVLNAVPADAVSRWWAFGTLCKVDMKRMGEAFGFSQRFCASLEEYTSLYHQGPSASALELKMKLRSTSIDYRLASVAFGAMMPAFRGEAAVFASVQMRKEPWRVKDLAVSGRDLLAEGIEGEQVGSVLEGLLTAVIENPSLNDKDRLLARAREMKLRS